MFHITTEGRELAEGMNGGPVFKWDGHSHVMEIEEGHVFICAIRSGCDQNDLFPYLWKNGAHTGCGCLHSTSVADYLRGSN